MKKATKEDRKRIGGWIRKWQTTLFLNDWDIKVYYPDSEKGNGCAASTDCSTRYYEASIDFFPSLFSEDVETQWKVVLHEMLHIVLSSMQSMMARPHNGVSVSPDELKDSLEQTTTRLTNVLNSAWPYKK